MNLLVPLCCDNRPDRSPKPVRPISHISQTGAELKRLEMSKSEYHVVIGGRDHVKHNGKKSKLMSLLMKFWLNIKKRITKPNVLVGNNVKTSRSPPKYNSGNGNCQRKIFHSATTHSPFEPSMVVPYAPHPTSFHPVTVAQYQRCLMCTCVSTILTN
jgi:hypothetical protein